MDRHKRSKPRSKCNDNANPFGITKDGLRRSTGSDHPEVQAEMAKSIFFSIPPSDWRAHDNGAASVRAAYAVLEEIAPSDALEGMLTSQMLTVHNIAMECFRRAMIKKQPAQLVDMYLRQAARLTSIYERQIAALDKRRGRGHQTIRVEHVASEDRLTKDELNDGLKLVRNTSNAASSAPHSTADAGLTDPHCMHGGLKEIVAAERIEQNLMVARG